MNPRSKTAAPRWWASAKVTAKDAIKKIQSRLGGNYTFGQKKCRHLYADNEISEGRISLLDVYAKFDLKTILKKLVEEAKSVSGDVKAKGNLQKRCWILLTYLVVDRPGKIKYNDMQQ